MNLTIQFDDGDRYQIVSLDLCFSTDQNGEREDEPICASFDICLNNSRKRMLALREGILKTEGVWWTSVDPIEPVQMCYECANISNIWDDDREYFVFGTEDS